MASPFVGEIRCFGFSFAPSNWAFCNGQLLSISQFSALFSILGTTYGGDGVQTFGLPNLQGQVPMHWGSGPGGFNTVLGEVQGTLSVTLTASQMPIHTHTINSRLVPPGGVLEHLAAPSSTAFISNSNPDGVYNSSPTLDTLFSNNAIGIQGGSLPHDNMQPYLALNFCICLIGIYPSRN